MSSFAETSWKRDGKQICCGDGLKQFPGMKVRVLGGNTNFFAGMHHSYCTSIRTPRSHEAKARRFQPVGALPWFESYADQDRITKK